MKPSEQLVYLTMIQNDLMRLQVDNSDLRSRVEEESNIRREYEDILKALAQKVGVSIHDLTKALLGNDWSVLQGLDVSNG